MHLVGYQHAAINNAVNVSAELLAIKKQPCGILYPIYHLENRQCEASATGSMGATSALLHNITDITTNPYMTPGPLLLTRINLDYRMND